MAAVDKTDASGQVCSFDSKEQKGLSSDYGVGGEDGEWAAYWFAKGYCVIREPKFSVRHSHYLGLQGWIAQGRNWKSLAEPHPFRPLGFRKNKTHAL